MHPEDIGATRITRSKLLQRAMASGVGLSAVGFLAACGDSNKPSGGGGSARKAAHIGGAITVLNYPGWIGPSEVKKFKAKHPGTSVRETADGFESLSGAAQKVAQNPGAYDVVMATVDMCQQLEPAGLVKKIDETVLPNFSKVEPQFRDVYPWGLALDAGAIVFGYRKDKVKSQPKSWADFWKLVPQHSRRVNLLDVDRDSLGSALLMLGLDGNTADKGDLDRAKAALLKIKPHVRSFKVTETAKGLLDGTADLVMSYNYELTTAQQKDPNIVMVVPEEGVIAYVEGMVTITKTDNPDTANAFVNSRLEPENYAEFIKTISVTRTSKVADQLLDKALLAPGYDLSGNLTYLKFVGEDGVKAWNRTWEEFKAA